MLYSLAADRSTRQVLWLHAARDRAHDSFAIELRHLTRALPHGCSYVCYSRPGPADRIAEDFDAAGHLSRSHFEEVGVPWEADVYLRGAESLHGRHEEMELVGFGVAPKRIHVEIFQGSEPITPGVVGATNGIPHLPKDDAGTGPLVSFARSGIAAHWKASA